MNRLKVLGPAAFVLVIAVVVMVVRWFGASSDPSPHDPPPSAVATATGSSGLPTAPVKAPYGSGRGTIDGYAIPAWSPDLVSARFDDPRVESYLLQAPPTATVAGWADAIPAPTRADAYAFTKAFLHGFYDRQYSWPRAAWASWVWENWAPLSMSPSKLGAEKMGQPSTLYRQRAMFLSVAMAPTETGEDTFAPASQEAWQRLGRMGQTSKITAYDAQPITLARIPMVGELWVDSDPAAQVFDVRLSVETRTNGDAPKVKDLRLLVFVTTAGETGGFGVQAMVTP